MILSDVFMALLGLAGLVIFIGIIVSHVPATPLIVVSVVVILMAAADFVFELREHARKSD